MKCPKGHDNPERAAFCNVCGQVLSTPIETAPTEMALPQSPPPSAPPVPNAAQPPTPDAAKRSRTGLFIGLGLAVVVVAIGTVVGVVALGGGSGSEGEAQDGRTLLQGALLLGDTSGDSVEGNWDDCQGTGGYADIGAGMALTVKDGDGNVVGSGNVESMTEETVQALAKSPVGGDVDPDEAASMLKTLEGSACEFYFSARVDDAAYYSIALADRGAPLTYSREDLAANDYWVFLTLGE